MFWKLLNEIKGKIEALEPENVLIFEPKLLTGLRAPAVPRFVVLGKSPLTNAIGISEAGGWWGPELKKAGYDALVIAGKSPKPVYLLITGEEVVIKDASKLWGLDTGETQDLIRAELKDNRVQVAQIGPAGENLVLYANIVNNLAHFNGRNGLGAVMGSKNLKAVAARGSAELEVKEPEKIKEISRWAAANVKVHPLSAMLHQHGTTVGIKTVNAQGGLPTNNFEVGCFRDMFEEAVGQFYSMAGWTEDGGVTDGKLSELKL